MASVRKLGGYNKGWVRHIGAAGLFSLVGAAREPSLWLTYLSKQAGPLQHSHEGDLLNKVCVALYRQAPVCTRRSHAVRYRCS